MPGLDIRMGNIAKKLGSVQALYRKNSRNRHHLSSYPLAILHSEMTGDSIRWMERAVIRGRGVMSLFQHPNSTVEITMPSLPDASFFETKIALQEEVWKKNESGVNFTVKVFSDGEQQTELSRYVHPKENPADRKWRTLSIDLSSLGGKEVRIELETSVPEQHGTAYAWAVWGDPHLYQKIGARRTFETLWNKFTAALRQGGVRGLIQSVRSRETTNTYQAWIAAHRISKEEEQRMREKIEHYTFTPTISIITPVYNADPRWLQACVESVQKQLYPKWELCLVDDGSSRLETKEALRSYENTDKRIRITFREQNGGIAAATNDALSLASGEFIALLDNDDELAPEALAEVVDLLQRHPEADMIYSDEDKLEEDGTRCEPFFKPDWSPEYFLSCMYTSHLGVYRRSIANEIGGFRTEYDKSQDYDFALRFIEKTTHDRILHIPKVLYHWRKIAGSTATSIAAKDLSDAPAIRAVQAYLKRNKNSATVEYDPETSYHRVRYAIEGSPRVSIILPTNGQIITDEKGNTINLLLQCLESIITKTTYPHYQVVIGHNNNLTPETAAQLERYAQQDPDRFTVVPYTYDEPFNFSTKINTLARHATGDYILLLNDDVEVVSGEWMTAMLEYAQQPEIGVVGAKLYFPNGALQHVGVVCGIGGGASHIFIGRPGNDPGYFSSTKVVRNYSVVTGACYMTKKSLFTELKGLDEAFRIDYNDVDYCLRAREKGFRVVWIPYAELTHHESVSLGTRAGQTDRPEEKLLRKRWASVIEHDPYYNPNLTLTDTNYQVKL